MPRAENPTNTRIVPAVSITTARTGASARPNAFGMRPMQELAYARRGEQYLLIKSPPASGKSRALMFIALDKLHSQGVKQALIVVPERSIGGSFADEPLTRHGFAWDWQVAPRWNLCNAPGADEPRVAKSKVDAVRQFLASSDRVHVVAMTGSYFRGDSEAVLSPADEARFETVTYTYYQQLNGYQWLKSLDIGYFFYTGRYVDAVGKVLDPSLKTIVHIPSVNSRESLQDKEREVNEIMGALGEWQGVDPQTGFHRIQGQDGRLLKVADLVDDRDAAQRTRVLMALKDPAEQGNRDHVDVIIALGMAKEGFDWIWCEHALTIGYRSSLTEIVQIIGRATRDAPGKERTRFTNLIAEPAADQTSVAEAVNDMLKAISASLLMEQVLAPRYEFTPKDSGAREGFDYGEAGYQPGGRNVGVNAATGQVHVEVKGLATLHSSEAARICREDLNEVVTSFLQDKVALERGLFDHEGTLPEELTQLRMGKIVRERYPELSEADQEAVRQRAVAAMALTQQAKLALARHDAAGTQGSTALIDGVRRFVNVRDLDIDLIDRINPFEAAYSVLAVSMDAQSLRQVQDSIAAKKISIPEDEARALALRALAFKNERGRLPSLQSPDPWERRMAEGVAALARYRSQARAVQQQEA